MMIDFHTHILPGMDDGSSSVPQSIQMLRQEKEQGIDEVFLTPHFYPGQNSPEQFLRRRQRAWEALSQALEPGLPRLRLGAEVQYFDGICHAEGMDTLIIQGTGLLLLELPFQRWSARVMDHVLELNDRENIQVVLAHIERYLSMQARDTLPVLLSNGILVQSNVSFFLHWQTRRRAAKMLERQQIHFLGSDCHNLESRCPNWAQLPIKITQLAKRSGMYFAGQLEEAEICPSTI